MILSLEFWNWIYLLHGLDSGMLRQTVRSFNCLKLLLVLIVCVLFSAALGVQQPSLLGASPTIYTQQTALAAAGLTTQTPANYQLTQTAALQQQAAAAAAALQQVKKKEHLLLTV